MSENKRTYTVDFQKDAIKIKLALRSASISSTAKELGIPEGMLHIWLKKFRDPKNITSDKNVNKIDLVEEVHKLQKENAWLREEKEILKKAAAYFSQHTK